MSELARANGAQLATLDRKIPASFVIPRSRQQAPLAC
jgi:hypothetical protein